MRIGNALSIFSQIINFVIFIYFIVVLLRLNVLDAMGLLISAFGLLASLVANIVSVIEVR
jgi:hypothetical protein